MEKKKSLLGRLLGLLISGVAGHEAIVHGFASAQLKHQPRLLDMLNILVSLPRVDICTLGSSRKTWDAGNSVQLIFERTLVLFEQDIQTLSSL